MLLQQFLVSLLALQFCNCQISHIFNQKLDPKVGFEQKPLSDIDAPKIKINRTEVDEFVKTVMDCHDILGTGLAIVQLDENDTVVDSYAQGYGVMDITENPPRSVNTTSKFCIGSTTKQFTAATLGKALMERGKSFDTQLTELLGENGRFFKHLNLGSIPTVRDLLSHRMGIPRYDGAWITGIEEKREDIWKRLHLLGDGDEHYLSKMYRSSFRYNNWMVSLAGYILEHLTNSTWEEEIRANYFHPLNMTEAGFIHTAPNFDDFAQVAYRVQGKDPGTVEWKPVNKSFIQDTAYLVAPAGTICLSANDMEKYLTFLVSKKVDPEMEPLKQSIYRTWFEASNLWAINEISDASVPKTSYTYISDEYALCLERGVYKSYQHVNHAGDIYGYNAQVYVFPRLKLGIMLSNSQGFVDPVYATPIALGLFDLVMPTTKDFTAEAICNNYPNATAMPNPDAQKPWPSCNKTLPSLHLEKLAGVYQHPVFGNVSVTYNATGDYPFRLKAGEFAWAILCQMDDNPTRFHFFYYNPDGPFWIYNDPSTQSEAYFAKDIGGFGTYVTIPGIEPYAPTVRSQRFFMVGYKPCAPNKCKNGGTCTPKGDFNYQCTCPPMVSGDNCEIGPMADCSDIKKYYPEFSGQSGVKQIQNPLMPNTTMSVYCDMETAGGGWTVIHRRANNIDTFNLTFDEYKNPIGRPGANENYWFGLDYIANLANSADKGYTIRIDLKDCDNTSAYEEYKSFWLDTEANSYTLHVDPHSATGTANDALTMSNLYLNHNGRPFTTFDHTLSDPNNCAKTYNSGWWFNDCFAANLNGVYYPNCQGKEDGIVWIPWRLGSVSMKFAQMMIRRNE